MRAETPSVLLIYTGGTIGMIENPETGALENFNFDHLLKHVPELKRFNYRISSYQFDPPLDSSDMEPAYWAKLVKIINYNYDYFDGFVILHRHVGRDEIRIKYYRLDNMEENDLGGQFVGHRRGVLGNLVCILLEIDRNDDLSNLLHGMPPSVVNGSPLSVSPYILIFASVFFRFLARWR